MKKKFKKVSNATTSAAVTAGFRTQGFGRRIYTSAAGPSLDTAYLPGTDVNPTISFHKKREWKTGCQHGKLHNHRQFGRQGKGRVVVTTVGTPKTRTPRHTRLPMSEPKQGKLPVMYERLRTKHHDNWQGSGDTNAGSYIY
jgi:hypothetical protein